MSEQGLFDISFMQADCLYKCSEKLGKPISDSLSDFCKFHILEYISACFEDLHLYGSGEIVSDIAKRIREGVDFAV